MLQSLPLQFTQFYLWNLILKNFPRPRQKNLCRQSNLPLTHWKKSKAEGLKKKSKLHLI